MENGPNLQPNADAVRHEHLSAILQELRNPEAIGPDGATLVDYYLDAVKDPADVVNRLPYNEVATRPRRIVFGPVSSTHCFGQVGVGLRVGIVKLNEQSTAIAHLRQPVALADVV